MVAFGRGFLQWQKRPKICIHFPFGPCSEFLWIELILYQINHANWLITIHFNPCLICSGLQLYVLIQHCKLIKICFETEDFRTIFTFKNADAWYQLDWAIYIARKTWVELQQHHPEGTFHKSKRPFLFGLVMGMLVLGQCESCSKHARDAAVLERLDWDC